MVKQVFFRRTIWDGINHVECKSCIDAATRL